MLPDLPELLVFLGAGFALNITPGPDMMYIAARTAADGRRAGIASALGVGTGSLFHIAFIAFGFGALVNAVPIVFTVVRLVGAAYLVYLGVRAVQAGDAANQSSLSPGTDWTAFRQGVVTNVLNPKVAMFFLAFLPQFVDAHRGSTALQVIALGLLFDVTGTAVNIVVALAASRLSSGLKRAWPARVLSRLCGVVFIGLGVRLALQTRK